MRPSACRPVARFLLALVVLAPPPLASSEEYLSPKYRPNPSIEPILAQVKPGGDEFPLEKPAEEIGERLASLGAETRREKASGVLPFLADGFVGGALRPARETAVSKGEALEVFRSEAFAEGALDAARFGAEWSAFLEPFRTVDTLEINVVKIDAVGADAVRAQILVDYDVVGPGRSAARAEKRGHWKMDWQKDARGTWRVARWTAIDETRSAAKDAVFTETSAAAFGAIPAYRQQLTAGVDFWRTRLDGAFMPDVLGHNGISAGDVDGDGFDDLYVCQPAGLPNRLFRNRGDGTFEDITEASGVGLLDASSIGLFADMDNDGDQDLVLVTFAQPLLFLNDGKGRFTPKARAFKYTEPPKGYLTSAAVADYDRDGFLDVFLCVYSFFLGEGKYGLPSPYHDALNGPPNILFRNDGLGGFVDVTKETIEDGNDRFSFAAAWGDMDGDGWPDLQVANDFGRKNLYRNSGKTAAGKVKLKDVAKAAGTEDYASAGMSNSWLDFNRDGLMDIYFGNMWAASGLRVTESPAFMPQATAEAKAAFKRHARGNTLYQNKGDGTFADVSMESGAEMGRWAWSSDAVDFDSDGWEDLYVVNGLVSNEDPYSLDSFFWRQTVARSPLDRKPKKAFEDGWKTINRLLRAHGTQAGWERNVLLRNDGAGHFDHVEGTAGLDLDHDGRAFAVTDLDHDGDPDLVTMARSGPRLRVFRNDYRGRESALVVRLTGKGSNRDAIGARVTVETAEGKSVKYLQAGSGFLSQHSKELHFGLGRSRAIERVTVRWPDGQEQAFGGITVNHRVSLEQGADAPTRVEPFAEAPTGASPAATDSTPSFEDRGTWLWQPYPAPDFTLDVEGRGRESLAALRGKTVLLQLFTSSGTACGTALADLAAQRAALEAAGVTVFAVALDDAAKARAFARTQAPGVAVAAADEAATLAYSVVLKYLFDRADEIVLPTSLLVDVKGDLVKVYRGPIPAAQMLADAPRITAATEERLARAVPFPGRFESAPTGRNYFQLGIELSLQGLDGPALSAFEKGAATAPEATTLQNLGTLYMKKAQTAKAQAAFERALTLQRDYPEASNSLGALLAQGGDLPGAVLQFQAALKGRPDYADAMNNLGYSYLQMGRSADALRLFEQAVKVDPDLAEAYNNLGIFHGQQDALEKAEGFFRTAAKKKPRYSEAINNLAMVVAALGRPAEAAKLVQDSLQDDPGFEMSYVTLCKIYLEAGRAREATQVLERLLQRNPKHPIGLQMLQQLKAAPPPRAPAR